MDVRGSERVPNRDHRGPECRHQQRGGEQEHEVDPRQRTSSCGQMRQQDPRHGSHHSDRNHHGQDGDDPGAGCLTHERRPTSSGTSGRQNRYCDHETGNGDHGLDHRRQYRSVHDRRSVRRRSTEGQQRNDPRVTDRRPPPLEPLDARVATDRGPQPSSDDPGGGQQRANAQRQQLLHRFSPPESAESDPDGLAAGRPFSTARRPSAHHCRSAA